MKLNLEVELDWIDEEMNIDDTVKQNVINAVVNKVQAKVESQVEKNINEIISKTIVSKINKMTEKLFNDFMGKELTITDNYGDVIKCYKSVTDVIKERFDKFMIQTVDDKGQTYDGSYSQKYQRLTFIIDKQLKDFANKFTTDAVKTVSEEIKLHVKEGLTNKLGAELMKVLRVNEMLQLPEKK
jgi:hypothetical protein